MLMKRFFFYSIIGLTMLFSFNSCSKLEFDEVFSGKADGLVTPLNFLEECGVEKFEINPIVADGILKQYYPGLTIGNTKRSYAFIINDPSKLEIDVPGQEKIDASMIDFDKYSLLLYMFMEYRGIGDLFDYRIRKTKNGLTLYAEYRPATYFLLDDEWYSTLAILLPKLPDGDVEIKNWYNENAEPLGLDHLDKW